MKHGRYPAIKHRSRSRDQADSKQVGNGLPAILNDHMVLRAVQYTAQCRKIQPLRYEYLRTIIMRSSYLFVCFAKQNARSKIKKETIRERAAANATRGENSTRLLLGLTRMTWTFTNRDVYLFKAAG